jgi:uncharacterized protein with PQ loop repeat
VLYYSDLNYHKHKHHQSLKKQAKLTSVDKLMYFASFAYPFTALPQIVKVYSTHNVQSLSLLSFVLYVVFGSIFEIYAISKKLTPLIIEGALWLVIYIAMLIGIVTFH